MVLAQQWCALLTVYARESGAAFEKYYLAETSQQCVTLQLSCVLARHVGVICSTVVLNQAS